MFTFRWSIGRTGGEPSVINTRRFVVAERQVPEPEIIDCPQSDTRTGGCSASVTRTAKPFDPYA